MNHIIYLAIALSFGLIIVLFEQWYSKYRTQKVKQKGLDLIPKYGFNRVMNDYYNYEGVFENYSVSLIQIGKIDFFARHALRLKIDFKWEDSFEALEIFASKQRNNHPQYQWCGNSIYLDIKFYLLKKETLDLLVDKLNNMINLLKSENLKAIDRNSGMQFEREFEYWQMKN